MSSIREQIDQRFRQARINKDDKSKNVIGMLKNKVLMELKSKADVKETDELWLRTIEAYAKQLRKSMVEFEKAGERGQEAMEEAKFELEFCESFLPKKLDEQQTDTLVRKVASENNINDPKLAGKLMGLLMKSHRDQIDGDLTRKIVQRVLAES